MEPKKYVFSGRTTGHLGHILHQIKAITNFGSVHKGDLGGWIESEENLSQEGTCWVNDEAKVFGNARISSEAQVFGKAYVGSEAQVYGKAQVYGEAEVFGKAHVYGEAEVFSKALVRDEARVFGEACVYGEAKIYGKAYVSSEAEVFGKAQVYGEARVFDKARVGGKVKVFGKARVCGEAWVFDKACVHGKAKVSDKACVSGEARVFDKAVITGTTTLRTTAYVQSQYDLLSVEDIESCNDTTTFYKTKEGGIDVACGCFKGSIEEFEKTVERTHGDNEHGRAYRNIIRVAKQTLQSGRLKEKPNNIKVLRHREICSGLSDLYERKNHDYGDSFHETFLEEGWAMPRIRLGDKYRRFCALTSSSESPLVKDETVRDTLLDLANYAILTVLEIDCGLEAMESITSKKGSEKPNPLTQTREEVEAPDQTYYYLNEIDPEKRNRVEIKFNLPVALQKMLNILKGQKVNLALYAAKDCNRFINENLGNEISKGGNRYELSIASCDLLASLILLLTDMGYTESQILEYIQDKWNREIKENMGG